MAEFVGAEDAKELGRKGVKRVNAMERPRGLISDEQGEGWSVMLTDVGPWLVRMSMAVGESSAVVEVADSP